jgi:uncharacterized protein YkwD
MRRSAFVLAVLAAASAAIAQKPASRDAGALERRVHHAINEQRKDRKLPELELEDRLSAIARAHSEDMARRRFFSHVNPDGADPTARGKRAGYVCRKVFGNTIREGLAENLFEGSPFRSADDFARRSVSGWMNSPGHRRNVLEARYSRTGVGVAISGDGVYVTQLFC